VGYLGPEPVADRLSFDNDAPAQVTPNIAIDISVNQVYELSEARNTEICPDKAITWLSLIMAAQSKPEISPWGRAVAGATGAVLANALVYPLDM
jgi:hypothetical protein